MESGKDVIVVLQSVDTALPFRPENYEVYAMEATGASFESIEDFIKEKGASVIMLDVPEMASDAIDLCRRLKGNQDFEALPLVALLRLPTRAIVTALIEVGVDEAVLLPTTEEIIAERLGHLIGEGVPIETAMSETASSPV